MHKVPEAPVDLARVHYQCKTCKATAGLKKDIKHGAACSGSTTTIGGAVDHVCTKSGKYPHNSKAD